ncbi:MAG: DNA mismatch repair protein MutS [Flavobacteriaceae bacterium]|nr:DNA mismatch repair protein MutS [Flavobacteriaceae bacterium]
MKGLHPNTLSDLEFDRVLSQIAAFSHTEAGKLKISELRPIQGQSQIITELKTVEEYKASFGSDQGIPAHGYEHLSRAHNLLEIENSLLELSEFKKIRHVCTTTLALILFFRKYKEFYVVLHEFSDRVAYRSEIVQSIDQVIDKYGQVRDQASEQLMVLRKSLLRVKSMINQSFVKALRHYAQLDYLDEIRETVVDNKRVLAVKAMHRRKVKGMVLGQSKTGSIVYIEPQQTLEFAQEFSQLVYLEAEEVKRLLKALTDHLRPYTTDLHAYEAFLTQMDVWHAKGRYAQAIKGIRPMITQHRVLSLKKAYHPLLLVAHQAEKKPTHPQDIVLDPERRIIVISGPNAGGKSITLKTVGLLQLMMQSGLLIPVDPQSEFCLFDRILTDIGDHQSIENHLSTYSYRLKQMNYFLKKCQKNTLFLIDEFGTGSDPELGGALAETFLEEFYARDAYGIITTHYTNLKLLADELPFAQNANMQFDPKTLEPLYLLHLGQAGSSYTFEVAQKNGIPYGLINRAKKKIERGKVRFDKTIANLQKERSALRATSQSLKTEEAKAQTEAKKLEGTQKRIQEKLERYQEIFDANQRLITLGKKIDQLAVSFMNKGTKKNLMEGLYKIVLQENSKRLPKKKVQTLATKPKKESKTKAGKAQPIAPAKDKELEAAVNLIREKKKAQKKESQAQPKPVEILKIGDRVRMIDGVAIGTIDNIEKQKAIVNYGSFTTNVQLKALEKV